MSFSVNVDLLNELLPAYNSAKFYMPNNTPSFGVFVRDYCFLHQSPVQTSNNSENVLPFTDLSQTRLSNSTVVNKDSVVQSVAPLKQDLSRTFIVDAKKLTNDQSNADMLQNYATVKQEKNNIDNKRKLIIDIDNSEQNDPFQKRAKLLQKETDSGSKFALSIEHRNSLCKERKKQCELAAANADTSDPLKRVAKYLDCDEFDVNVNVIELFAVAKIVQSDHKPLKSYANALLKLMSQVPMQHYF